MKIWGDYVHQNHPGPDAERKVLAAYKKYRAIELEAIDAAHVAADSMSSTNSATATVNTVLQSPEVQQALTDLVEVIRQFGAKI
jgi:hypothetical protein